MCASYRWTWNSGEVRTAEIARLRSSRSAAPTRRSPTAARLGVRRLRPGVALCRGAHRGRRVEADELVAQLPPALVLERVNRGLRAPDSLADLARAHPEHEPQHDHLALVLRQGLERLA